MMLSTKQIADVCGMSTDAVLDWEHAGKIPAAIRTFGNHRRWRSEEVAAVLLARGYEVPAEWSQAVAP